MILFIFLTFIMIFSLFAYPQLIYTSHIKRLSKSIQPYSTFIKGSAESFSTNWCNFCSFNDALISASPAFRDFAINFGTVIAPLANLDDVGKYLVFQNVAAWIAALSALLYKGYLSKTRPYIRKG